MGFFTSIAGANIDEPQLEAVNRISNDNKLSDSKLEELSKHVNSGKTHIYLFVYWRDCGHCKRSYKDWEAFEKKMSNNDKCVVFAIEQSGLSELSSEMLGHLGGEPSGFPSFRHIFNGKATEYNGERDVSSLEAWAKETCGAQSGGGIFDLLVGVDRIRGQKYEKWLEQRLVLEFNDVDYVNEIRKKFGYDKTNVAGRGQLTKEMVQEEVCKRSEEDKKLISSKLSCGSSGGGKTRKRKRQHKKTHKKRRHGKKNTKKHK